MKSIKWYESKTVWLNVIMFLIAIVPEVTGTFHFGENGLTILGSITLVLNLALRLFSTSKPIAGTNAPSQ